MTKDEITCSVLIPSRSNPSGVGPGSGPQGLDDTIASIYETAKGRVEVLIRIDSDDREIPKYQELFARWSKAELLRTALIIGPRDGGYGELNLRYDELAYLAVAPWILVFNDDAQIHGTGWAEQLSQIPTSGKIVYAENYQLGASVYHQAMGYFPIVPRSCWKKFGWERLVDPIDSAFDSLLRVQNGWEPIFLSGMTMVHDGRPR